MSKRDKVAALVKDIIDKESKILKADISSSDHGRKSDKKCGIYYIFDENDIIIYAGKVGDSDSTSLYDRMIGHGSGAHAAQTWWKEVSYVKFHKFEGYDESKLYQVERLAILGANTPKYNDKTLPAKLLDELLIELSPPGQ